jgi:hypothetical protein
MPSPFMQSDASMGRFKTLRTLLAMRQATFRPALGIVIHRDKEESGAEAHGRRDRTGQDRTGQDRLYTIP